MTCGKLQADAMGGVRLKPDLRGAMFEASDQAGQDPAAAEVRVAEPFDVVAHAVGQGQQQPVVRHAACT